MTASRPRRWFQIHLSTAVVLMFVAGIILWQNLSEHPQIVGRTFNDPGFEAQTMGWPMAFYFNHNLYEDIWATSKPQWLLQNLLVDVLTGIFCLVMATLLFEFLARRREPPQAMTAPRPRRWFQIHLSTAVVLMVVVSALVGANIVSREKIITGEWEDKVTQHPGPPLEMHLQVIGWPAWFAISEPIIGGQKTVEPKTDKNEVAGWGTDCSGPKPSPLSIIITNLIVGLLICALVWWSLESLIRRREARKP